MPFIYTWSSVPPPEDCDYVNFFGFHNSFQLFWLPSPQVGGRDVIEHYKESTGKFLHCLVHYDTMEAVHLFRPMTFFALLVIVAFYFVALLLELHRLVRQHRLAAPFACIGFLIHSFCLFQQHGIAEHHLGGAAMFFFASAWGLILIYLLWSHVYPNIPFGLVLLPLILLMMGGGLRLAAIGTSAEIHSRPVAKMLHAVPAAGVMITLSIACTCCLFYFLESYLLHKKRSLPLPVKLPSLEWSLSVCRLSSIVAVCCLGLCVIGGILLNIHRHAVTIWQDPLVAGTLCLCVLFFLGPLKWLFQSHRTVESRLVLMCIMFAYILFLTILVIALATSGTHWNKP